MSKCKNPNCTCENCQCGDDCRCGKDCSCGDNCQCTPENKCGDDCACGSKYTLPERCRNVFFSFRLYFLDKSGYSCRQRQPLKRGKQWKNIIRAIWKTFRA